MDGSGNMEKENKNIRETFWGGKTQMRLDYDGNEMVGEWEYTCVYGKMRICYSEHDFRDNFRHFSIHWNNKDNKGKVWNFHIAYKFKPPRLIVGFEKIWKLKLYSDQD